MRDTMTGTESRICYERDILELDREHREHPEQRFIFLFADMNNLKSVNGMYGHSAGDEYIAFIGETLRRCLKTAEHIYRMGGDEFLAIYRNAEEATVIREIEAVRDACDKEAEKRSYKPLLAMGYAVSGPQYESLHEVLRAADYMMYQNKADLKLQLVQKAGYGGTRLNLSGLTDRIFEVFCAAGDDFYPFLQNLHTGVTRIAPGMMTFFGLDSEFQADFHQEWLLRVHPEDRETFRKQLDSALRGEEKLACRCRLKDREGRYILTACHGAVYHGRDGEPDYFSGYLLPEREAEKK